ncbi:MAG: MOSC domain-containing protein [Methylococcaceae bacterium]|jgi:MOSC domain-containing protein YiiM
MTIIAISRGRAKQVRYRDRWVETGIYKAPITGPVSVTMRGLEGDVQVDRKNHGGQDKAIYVYSQDNYPHWERQLGIRPLESGYFGENLTVSGLLDTAVQIGDIYRMGPVLTQVTQPRVPCFKLGIKMGDPAFVASFLTSGRTGFYLRVLEEGELCMGTPIDLIERDPKGVPVAEAMQALLKGPSQSIIIRKVLAIAALSSAWREDLEQRLTSD